MNLVKYDAARYALQQAATIDEVKDIVDKSVAIAAYAKQAQDTQMIEWATEIRVRAERKAGEMLAQVGIKSGNPQWSTPSTIGKTLEEIGISKYQSSRWQKLAAVPEDQFEQAIVAAKEVAGEITSAAMLRVEKANRPIQPKPEKVDQTPPIPAQNPADYSAKDMEIDQLKDALEALRDENEHLEYQLLEITKRIDAGDPLVQVEWSNLIEELASLRNENKNFQRNIGAITSSRDRYMNENAELKNMIKFQRKELDKAKK